jgi:hypothetical protein
MSSPLIIRPRAESVEGQPILRPLPSAQCRSVGPFVFFDHMLETDYAPGMAWTSANTRISACRP